MRIDSSGMPIPDDPPPQRDPLWHCPNCGRLTWPGLTVDYALAARHCVPCQAAADLATDEMRR